MIFLKVRSSRSDQILVMCHRDFCKIYCKSCFAERFLLNKTTHVWTFGVLKNYASNNFQARCIYRYKHSATPRLNFSITRSEL